ncbi:alpha/beta fold hydrolase [Solicola sp. PLA-1-18]|uniref:alpha/beta fold hydrolase n=1 Tax=Solicola sp. PLA-1-18 TaxID=3380532 RepID=UPI003B7651A2
MSDSETTPGCWYRDLGGDGPVLVLLHAFPLSSRTWEPLVEALDGVRVVLVDLPGLGRSPVPDGPATMAHARDLVLGVLDGIGVGRAVLHGVSTGGYVALAVAAHAPERVAGLALGSTTTRRIEPDVPDERLATADEVERSGSTGPVRGSADDGLGATAHRDQPHLVDLLRSIIDGADPRGVAWMARAIASRDDTTDALRDLERPVLLLFGDEDEGTPPVRGEEMRDARRPGSDTELVVLPGVGHLTGLEQPRRVADVLLPWVRRAWRP